VELTRKKVPNIPRADDWAHASCAYARVGRCDRQRRIRRSNPGRRGKSNFLKYQSSNAWENSVKTNLIAQGSGRDVYFWFSLEFIARSAFRLPAKEERDVPPLVKLGQ